MMKNIQLLWELAVFAIQFSVKNRSAKETFFTRVQSVL